MASASSLIMASSRRCWASTSWRVSMATATTPDSSATKLRNGWPVCSCTGPSPICRTRMPSNAWLRSFNTKAMLPSCRPRAWVTAVARCCWAVSSTASSPGYCSPRQAAARRSKACSASNRYTTPALTPAASTRWVNTPSSMRSRSRSRLSVRVIAWKLRMVPDMRLSTRLSSRTSDTRERTPTSRLKSKPATPCSCSASSRNGRPMRRPSTPPSTSSTVIRAAVQSNCSSSTLRAPASNSWPGTAISTCRSCPARLVSCTRMPYQVWPSTR
ncbi:hypothetical protein D3C75_582870 [compost metagenome]